jgi:hypothetical protein
MKRRRLEHLRYETDKLIADVDSARVHITRGGKTLARNRLHHGEAGKRFGNETI